ncbi:MAG: hypothetical protein GY703_25785 [Gammaproteobacteria bacterium]|nr:hypothetical protein [Gammaproteobacteria bacterium]
MENARYSLVLTGATTEGHSREDGLNALERMMRMSHEQAERLLQGRPSRLQKPMTRDRAQTLMKQIHACGIGCSLVPEETKNSQGENQDSSARADGVGGDLVEGRAVADEGDTGSSEPVRDSAQPHSLALAGGTDSQARDASESKPSAPSLELEFTEASPAVPEASPTAPEADGGEQAQMQDFINSYRRPIHDDPPVAQGDEVPSGEPVTIAPEPEKEASADQAVSGLTLDIEPVAPPPSETSVESAGLSLELDPVLSDELDVELKVDTPSSEQTSATGEGPAADGQESDLNLELTMVESALPQADPEPVPQVDEAAGAPAENPESRVESGAKPPAAEEFEGFEGFEGDPSDMSEIVLETPAPFKAESGTQVKIVPGEDEGMGDAQYFEPIASSAPAATGRAGKATRGIKIKWLIPAVGLVLLLAAGGAGMFFLSPGAQKAVEKQAASSPKKAAPALKPADVTRKRRDTLIALFRIQYGVSFNPEQVSLSGLEQDMQLKPNEVEDGWGTKYRYQPQSSSYLIISAGGDRQFGTDDDLKKEVKLEEVKPGAE